MSWLDSLLVVRYAYTHGQRRSSWRLSARETVRRAFGAIKGPGRRYRLRIDGGDPGPFREPKELKRRARTVLVGRVGAKVILQAVGDDGSVVDQVRLHRAEKQKAVPDIGAAPEINRIHYAVWTTFGGDDVRSGGTYACRYVSGSRTVSRHGYRTSTWKGAAEDIFVTRPDTMAHLWDVANFIVAETLAGRLQADRVICGDRMWTRGVGWQRYKGTYHTHVHVEVWQGYPCTP